MLCVLMDSDLHPLLDSTMQVPGLTGLGALLVVPTEVRIEEQPTDLYMLQLHEA